MYKRCSGADMSPLCLAESTRASLIDDLPLVEYQADFTEEIVGVRFAFGTLMWLDIFDSITAGTAPRLITYHSSVLAAKSQIKLDALMGCKNGLMVQIGRIAALYDQKCQSILQGPFNCSSLEHIFVDITREIQCGLAQGALESFNISGGAPATVFGTMPDPSTPITRMFLHAASIYLHLVVQGFQELEVLDTNVSEVMAVFQTLTSPQTLQALILPLFFVGCVAKQDDEQFFRNAFSSPLLLNPLLQHRGKLLPILEEIWIGRRTLLGFGWEDCVKLTKSVLLI